MTIFLGPSHLVPKHELSSRPERSEVEVLSTSQWLLNESDTLPLCHPERSREPALSEVEWGSAVQLARPGNVFSTERSRGMTKEMGDASIERGC